jgi:endonuclease YncB( thermonuclease family)
MRNRLFSATNCILLALLSKIVFGGNAEAAEKIAGPVAAELIRVVDGDTVLVSAMPWPNHHVTTYVRLRGIDAPELKSRCAAVRSAAEQAQSTLTDLLNASPVVALTDISGDKYYGRVVAAILLADGSNPATALLSAGLVDPYRGGRKKVAACP